MKRENLKELGLTDGVVDQIMAHNGRDIERHKARAQAIKEELDAVKEQLAEASRQLEGFKDLDIDGIRRAADDWKEKYEAAEKENKARVAQMEFDNLLCGKLAGVKFTSEFAKKGVLDELRGKGLKVENGSILGFDQVLRAIKEAHPDAFESGNPPPQFSLRYRASSSGSVEILFPRIRLSGPVREHGTHRKR